MEQETNLVEQGPLTQYELSGKSNVDLPGMKNVSLGIGPSEQIRAKLMQMIQEREAKRGGWSDFIDTMTAVSGEPANFTTDWNNYQKRKSERDQELMQMYASVGQLDTEAQRNQILRAQEAARLQRNAQLFGGEPSNSPLIAQNQQENAMASRLRQLPRETQMSIKSLLDSPNPQIQAKGYEQLIAATRPSDLERNIALTGATGPQAQGLALAHLFPKAGELTETTIPGDTTGSTMRVPALQAVMQNVMGGPTPFNQAAPQSGLSAVSPQPAQAPTGGLSAVAPEQPAPAQPAPVQAPAPSARPVAPAPAPTKPAVQAPKENPKNPYTSSNYNNPFVKGSTQWQDEEKKRMALYAKWQEDEANIDRSGRTAEAQAEGKRMDEEKAAIEDAGKSADRQITRSIEMIRDVEKAKDVVGLLGRYGPGSAFLNAISQGIQAGNVGSVAIPSVQELAVQLSGDLAKLSPKQRQETIDAYHRVMMSTKQIALEYTRAMFKGQGSVTENERRLIMEAIGDPSKLSPANLKRMAIAVQIEAQNAKAINQLWMKSSETMSWKEFRRSPQYMELKQKLYNRAAQALGIKDPKPFDPKLER